LLAILAIQF
jgi:malonyl-CoA/methylmalonyl-CoA synthetase